MAENWKKFKQRFDLYLEASGAAEKQDKTKTCILLYVIGEAALELYNNFKWESEDDKYKYEKVKKQFDDYCTPRKNETYERHKFFTCTKKSSETFDAYVNELRTKARTYGFGDLTESLIRDRLICGIQDDILTERLLRVQDLTLEKAVTMCRAAESTKEHMKKISES